MSKRLYFYNEHLDECHSSDESSYPGDCEPVDVGYEDEANLVGSLCDDGFHRPVIDIDLPCKLVPSSTEGHFHLYIEKAMSYSQYLKLLDAMAEAGVVEKSYVRHVKERKMSMCRPEWCKKPVAENEESPPDEKLTAKLLVEGI